MMSLLAWLKFRRAGVPLSFLSVVVMSLQRVLTRNVIESIIIAHKHDLEMKPDDLKVQALAGGHPLLVAEALASAKEQGLMVEWKALCAVDLAGRDPKQMVSTFAEAKIKNPNMTFEQMIQQLFEFENQQEAQNQ